MFAVCHFVAYLTFWFCRFKERSSLNLNNYQKPTEEEIKERMARSSRTVPEGIEGFSALTNNDFMSNLFSGGL